MNVLKTLTWAVLMTPLAMGTIACEDEAETIEVDEIGEETEELGDELGDETEELGDEVGDELGEIGEDDVF